MEQIALLKFFSAFVLVICLMAGLAWFLKRSGFAGTAFAAGAKRRLRVVEVLPVDQRRRLLLVRRDDVEHLILLGPQGETVVETGIPAAADNVVTFAKDQKNVQA